MTDCGYQFEEGEEYFVFAERKRGKEPLAPGGSLYASTCSPTALTGEDSLAKRELEKRKPTPLAWKNYPADLW